MTMYRRFRTRSGRTLIALVLSVPALAGCYEYVPISAASPNVGQDVTLEITDAGRVQLSDRFGAGLAAIEGRVQTAQADQLVLSVYRVSHINGDAAMWSGETVRLNRSYVGQTKGRELSRTRTTLVAVGAVAAVGALLASARLAGVFNGSSDEPTPPTNLSMRLPLRIPLGLRP